MDSDTMPDEEVQFTAYKKVIQAFGDRPVIIRTLDIGGDKKLPYLPLEEEMNPFLGLRAIRLCFQNEELFKTQLRDSSRKRLRKCENHVPDDLRRIGSYPGQEASC